MARRRNRFNKAELHNIVISLMFMAGGINCILAALLLRAQGKNLVALLGACVLALLMAARWFFENPFHSARPLTTLIDVVTVAAVVIVLNGLLIYRCWPLGFAVLVEIFFITRFYRNNRPQRR